MIAMRITKKLRLFASTAVIGMLLPGVAVAQSQPPSVPAAPAATTSGNQGGLEDIVVTAQRRSESQQNVPISITTVTAASALRAGVSGTESLGVAVPALQFGRQSGLGGTPYLRGVGTNAAAPGTESPVAVYIDDVYVGSAAGTLMQFNNIDSVEVLKGPQGTLFGRNATGGVIEVHTKKPSYDPAVDVTGGFASYNHYLGSVYATGGLSSNVAVSLALLGDDQSKGYGRAVYSGRDIYKYWTYGVRGQLLWEPGPNTKFALTGDYTRGNSDIGTNPTIAPGTVAVGGATFPGQYRSTNDPADISKTRNYGFSAKITQDLGAVSLVSISAYRNVSEFLQLDSDGSLKGNPAIVNIPNSSTFTHTVSQELQALSNSEGPLTWIVGGFYYRSSAGFDPIILNGLAFIPLGGSQTTRASQILNSYSGFGEASYSLQTGTKLTLGLRYTDESLSQSVLQLTGTGAALSPSPFTQHSGFSKLTYRAILDQKIGRDLLLYASYSRGFRSGAYNLNAPTVTVARVSVPAPVVLPEVLDAAEVGIKSELFDRKVRLNVSAFHYNYNNLQISSIQSNLAVVLLNAAKARMQGIDADFSVVPTKRVNIDGGISLLDAKFVSFPSGPYYVQQPAVCNPVPASTGPASGGALACSADLKGYRTPRSPKLTGSISVTYTIPTEVGSFALTGSLYHNSGYYWEVDNEVKQPGYNLLNASIQWTSSSKKYEVRVYAKNPLNEYYYSYFSESTLRFSGAPEMPRNYGVSVTAHF